MLDAAQVNGQELPLDFMLRLMRDPDVDQAVRLDCAKSAAPYLHARLAPALPPALNLPSIKVESLTDHQLDILIRRLETAQAMVDAP